MATIAIMPDLNVTDKGLEVTAEAIKAVNVFLNMFKQFYVDPAATRKNAHAQADAYKIIELTKLEVNLQKEAVIRDAVLRKLNEAIFQEINFKTVVGKAALLLTDKDRPTDPDTDWKSSFVRHAEDVSDTDMQILWAKILVGEATQPGSFSKRTMKLVSEMSKEEAILFTTICRYSLKGIGPIILNFDDPIYQKNGLHYSSLSKFSATGLVVFASTFNHAITGLQTTFGTAYFDRMLHFCKLDGTLTTGKISFTPEGSELSRIIKPEPVKDFFEYLLNKWSDCGPTWSDGNSSEVIESLLGRQEIPQPTAVLPSAVFGPE